MSNLSPSQSRSSEVSVAMASPQNPEINPQLEQEEDRRNWAELNRDILVGIFRLVGIVGVLKSAGRVCRSWRKVTKDEPALWRRIDLTNHGLGPKEFRLIDLAKLAIDRSGGRVEEFWIQYFGDDDLLQYLCDRTSMLKSFRLISCKQVSEEAVVEMSKSQHLLEELEISHGSYSENLPELIGKELPHLKRFTLNYLCVNALSETGDTEALGIANSMHELRHLQLMGNSLTSKGLKAILEGCPHLETLDVRQCICLDMDESDMRARCARLKTMRLPYDSLDDYQLPLDVRWIRFLMLI